MWCTSVSTNTVNVINRGAYGTTAASHSSGAICRNAPRFPRASILRAINDTIRAVYPDLYAVATTTFLINGDLPIGYSLPAETREVIDVFYDSADATSHWPKVQRYAVNLNANTTEFATGRNIDIFDAIQDGATVQVVYKKEPSVLVNLADVFATVTGLQDSAKEAIVYGACARLFGYTLPANFQTQAASAVLIDPERGGDPLSLSRYFYQMHLQARAEEQRRLNEKYPPRIHWLR